MTTTSDRIQQLQQVAASSISRESAQDIPINRLGVPGINQVSIANDPVHDEQDQPPAALKQPEVFSSEPINPSLQGEQVEPSTVTPEAPEAAPSQDPARVQIPASQTSQPAIEVDEPEAATLDQIQPVDRESETLDPVAPTSPGEERFDPATPVSPREESLDRIQPVSPDVEQIDQAQLTPPELQAAEPMQPEVKQTDSMEAVHPHQPEGMWMPPVRRIEVPRVPSPAVQPTPSSPAESPGQSVRIQGPPESQGFNPISPQGQQVFSSIPASLPAAVSNVIQQRLMTPQSSDHSTFGELLPLRDWSFEDSLMEMGETGQ